MAPSIHLPNVSTLQPSHNLAIHLLLLHRQKKPAIPSSGRENNRTTGCSSRPICPKTKSNKLTLLQISFLDPSKSIHSLHHQISPLSSTVGIPANLHIHHLKNPKITPHSQKKTFTFTCTSTLPSPTVGIPANLHTHQLKNPKNHPSTLKRKHSHSHSHPLHQHQQWEHPLITTLTILLLHRQKKPAIPLQRLPDRMTSLALLPSCRNHPSSKNAPEAPSSLQTIRHPPHHRPHPNLLLLLHHPVNALLPSCQLHSSKI